VVLILSQIWGGLLSSQASQILISDDGEALDVKVRQFSWNFRVRKRGEEYVILKGREKIGSLWFDVAD
jgi:hypothetical protein